jgi:hypothetical protein
VSLGGSAGLGGGGRICTFFVQICTFWGVGFVRFLYKFVRFGVDLYVFCIEM